MTWGLMIVLIAAVALTAWHATQCVVDSFRRGKHR